MEFEKFKAKDGIRFILIELFATLTYGSTYVIIKIPELVKNEFSLSFFMAFDNKSKYKVDDIDVLVCDSNFFKKQVFCDTEFKIILNPTKRISIDTINKKNDWCQIKCEFQKSNSDNIIVIGNFNNPKEMTD